MDNVSVYMAFVAGLISFVSPCVLPLVPGYISFISGISSGQLANKNGSPAFRRKEKAIILLNSVFFVLGFSVVFVLLGASATWIGELVISRMSLLSKIAGLVIIFFGIFKMGLIPSLFLYRETKFHLKDKKFGLAGAFIIGSAFAFGWTPCIGPILAAILTYAATLKNVTQGIVLLFIYSMGLGIPFLLTALGVNQFFRFFEGIKKHLGLIEKISGIIMVILGLMIFFNKLIPGKLHYLLCFICHFQ
jgi:cytochrome c-type biogenesis protein